MVGVERMQLLRPRARTRCALVYNFHSSSGKALLPSGGGRVGVGGGSGVYVRYGSACFDQ